MLKKILVTGANGLVGSAIRSISNNVNDFSFEFVSRKRCDLTKENEVRLLFERERPNYVIHTAARVGGVGGNLACPADYFYENILMNAFVLNFAAQFGVEKLIAFSSVCVFPSTMTLQEDRMHDGPPWGDNFAYAHAKRMVDVQIEALKKQHHVRNYTSLIPGNIFGTNDLYNIDHGHIIPSLIHKIYRAKYFGEKFIVWGDGQSLREFIYTDDLAIVCLKLLEMDNLPPRLIVSGEREYSIRDIVDILVDVSGYNGIVYWDTSKPNGQRSRPSDKTIFNSYFPNFEYTPIRTALHKSWLWFEKNYPNVRGIKGE